MNRQPTWHYVGLLVCACLVVVGVCFFGVNGWGGGGGGGGGETKNKP